MIRFSTHGTTGALRLAICTLLGASVLQPLVAQDTTAIAIDFGVGTPRAIATGTVPDSILALALTRFNAPATVRLYGGAQINAPVAGAVGVYNGDARISSHVDGDLVIINGSLRLDPTAVVTGRIVILGGAFYPDRGARFSTPVLTYSQRASVRLTSDATLVATTPSPSLRELAGRASWRVGDVVVSPRLDFGVYNRVEGLSLRLGPSFRWQAAPDLRVAAMADLILRTADDPTGTRDGNGWWARIEATRDSIRPLTIGLTMADEVAATADAPLRPAESSLAALVMRRDYRDWYATRGTRVDLTWRFTPTLAVEGAVAFTRERSLTATDAFSLLRGGEAWRANPLVDDGRYTALSLGLAWDTRDAPILPRDGWWIRVGVRRNSSSDLTPFVLPDVVRDPLPSEGYASFEGSFDLRRYQRIDPRHAVHLRMAGEGWIGGDPLTIQRRLGLGGTDVLFAYPFRSISCDSRRRPDPAQPALCDRRMTLQAEIRRRFDLGISTRIGPYGLGVDRVDAIVFTDWGSAWLAGDGPGQVPSGRIQALSEWRGALGVGVDAGWIGAYLARAVTDNEPFRFSFRLQRRF